MTTARPRPASDAELISPAQRQALVTSAHGFGWKDGEVLAMLKAKFGFAGTQAITQAKYGDVVKALEAGVEVGAK